MLVCLQVEFKLVVPGRPDETDAVLRAQTTTTVYEFRPAEPALASLRLLTAIHRGYIDYRRRVFRDPEGTRDLGVDEAIAQGRLVPAPTPAELTVEEALLMGRVEWETGRLGAGSVDQAVVDGVVGGHTFPELITEEMLAASHTFTEALTQGLISPDTGLFTHQGEAMSVSEGARRGLLLPRRERQSNGHAPVPRVVEGESHREVVTETELQTCLIQPGYTINKEGRVVGRAGQSLTVEEALKAGVLQRAESGSEGSSEVSGLSSPRTPGQERVGIGQVTSG